MKYEDDDAPPPRKIKRRSEEMEDEDDRPRARSRRSRDDDDDEDDRPRRRRKKRRRESEGDGPWLIAIGVVGVCTFVSFVMTILFNGLSGFPPAQDGPLVKVGCLGLGLLIGLGLAGWGTLCVKNRVAYGRWNMEIRGTMGVVLGMIEAGLGGVLCGILVYGLFFMLICGQ